jgi:hypothetical protein
MKRRMAVDEIPCSSGVLRGSFEVVSAAKAKTDANNDNTRAGMILIAPPDEMTMRR